MPAPLHRPLSRTIHLPHTAHLGPRALSHLPTLLTDLSIENPLLALSADLPPSLLSHLPLTAPTHNIPHATIPEAERLATLAHANSHDALLALGGGRALDTAKYAAALAQLPFIAIPTSLSHDGFASPNASLTNSSPTGPNSGHRTSLLCTGPAAILVDTGLTSTAPAHLTLAGIGDLLAKLSSLTDYSLAHHLHQSPFDGIAHALTQSALTELTTLSPSNLNHTSLARALLLSGLAISAAGSSAPCSGSEHLLSHALDALTPPQDPPASHGLQVALATLLTTHLQSTIYPSPETHQTHTQTHHLFQQFNLLPAIQSQQIPRTRFEQALHLAPTLKPHLWTILSHPQALPIAKSFLQTNPTFASLFT